jgi:kynurenine formamidase
MPFIDLSHTIEHGMTTYPGLPGPLICDYLSREASRAKYAAGVEFQIGKIEMVANTGTYVDAPFHRFPDGKDLSALALEALANVEAIVIRAPTAGRAVGRDAFRGRSVRGKAVLVRTGWDVHWGTTAYLDGHPYLTGDVAAFLVDEGAALVGIDSLNIDDMRDGARPVHSTLLGADIPIVEHLCHLGQLPDEGFRFSAVPPKVAGMGSFPVRAFATL